MNHAVRRSHRNGRGAAAPLPFRVAIVLGGLLGGTSDAAAQGDQSREVRPLPTATEAISDSSLQLSFVEAIVVDSRGLVYVKDRLSQSITVLDRDLTFIQTVGRSGSGPGEFNYITRMGILDADSLFVYDRDLDRMTVFDPDTRVVAYTLPNPLGVSPDDQRRLAQEVFRVSGGPAYLGVSRRPFYASEESATLPMRTDIVVSVDSSGTFRDSVIVVPSPEMLVARRPGRVSAGPHPFGRTSWIRPLGRDRFVYANSGHFDVAVLDLTGDTVQSFSYSTTTLPVTADQMDAHVSDLRQQPELAAALRDGAPYTWPPLGGLVVDDSGATSMSIWVGVRGGSGDDAWEWAGFTDDGEYVGSVFLPAGAILMAARGQRMVSVSLGDFDVPEIHSHRIMTSLQRGQATR